MWPKTLLCGIYISYQLPYTVMDSSASALLPIGLSVSVTRLSVSVMKRWRKLKIT